MTSPAPSFGPCAPWDPIWACTLTGDAPAFTGTAVQVATEILWQLSGQQFGTCEVTLRPCRRDCVGNFPFLDMWWDAETWPRPVLYQGAWFNVTCGGGCGTSCSCTVVEEALLPAPVASIVQVKLNGSVMVTGSYRVDDNRLLVRTDGGRWPFCQDLTKDDTQPNTWSVTATYGQAVPLAGQLAVGELACEISKSLAGQSCKLPQPVQQIARQGVTVTFLDPNMVLAQGRLGLYFCDLFLAAFNPERLQVRPRVFDVDSTPWRRTNT